MFCVYLTVYSGYRLPRRYIGSSSVESVCSGYNGSVSSSMWKHIFLEEQRDNKHLFKTRILSIHTTRQAALDEECRLHINYNVVKSDNYMNQAIARVNGYFGRDVSGENNPMFGQSREGETHQGGNNITAAKKKFYSSERGVAWKVDQSARVSGENNPMFNKTHSDELKLRWSAERSGSGNPMYGQNHTAETRQLISDTRKTRIASGEISPWNKGLPMTEDQKQKLRKPRTDEQKQNMRNIYLVNGDVVYNAKQYCLDNNLSYICFTQAAKRGKIYKGLVVEKKNDFSLIT